jgi:hypothetical protein
MGMDGQKKYLVGAAPLEPPQLQTSIWCVPTFGSNMLLGTPVKPPRHMKRNRSMLVTFVRTGERRYAVRAAVEGKAVVEMSPAPGYDAIMPHDLQHFIVERVLGIDGAVFGQLAAGGTAGTFHVVGTSGSPRRARERRKRARKQAKLAFHRDDPARSERATFICWTTWLSRSDDPTVRAKAREMQETVRSMLQGIAHFIPRPN